jgi:hypothetical protein
VRGRFWKARAMITADVDDTALRQYLTTLHERLAA